MLPSCFWQDCENLVTCLRALESTSVSSRAISPSIWRLRVGSLVTPYLQHVNDLVCT